MRALAVALAAILAGCAAPASDIPVAVPSTATPHATTFVSTVVDEAGGVGEPSLVVADGSVWVAGPLGSASRRADALWRSEDGLAFRSLGTPTYPFGGGDTDLDVRDGTVFLSGIWGGAVSARGTAADDLPAPGYPGPWCVSLARAVGDGAWEQNPVACDAPGVLDRQWVGLAADGTVYVAYMHYPIGLVVARSEDAGRTFPDVTLVPGTNARVVGPNPLGGDHGGAGDIVLDDARPAWLLVPYASAEGVGVFVSDDRGASWAFHRAAESETADSGIPVAARDAGGRTYLVWYDAAEPPGVRLAVSDDDGATWGAPERVAPGLATALPWVAAGAAGTVAVGFYGAETEGDPEAAEADVPWYGHVAVARAGAPAVVTRLGEDPVHLGPICVTGGACDPSTRRLLDFLQVRIDAADRVHVVLADDARGPGEPVLDVYFAETSR